jgi:N-acetyl-anhydromuramyl-L-alanine amidase AmpD
MAALTSTRVLTVGADAGWLEGVPRHTTHRTSQLVVPEPLAVVWHYTGGVGAPGDMEKLVRRIAGPNGRDASWHVIIARDGSAIQSAPFNVGTWHVGLPGSIGGTAYRNVNRVTVGIELVNAGRLARVDGKWYCHPYWRAGLDGLPTKELGPDPRLEIAAGRAVAMRGEGTFDDFPSDQIVSATAILKALVERFGWSREACSYGHVDFRPPSGKEDPGPLWKNIVLPGLLRSVFDSGGT